MKTKRLVGLVALAFLVNSVAALAQQSCDPKAFSETLDVYANEPFGARSWRKLAGLGDPGIEPAGAHWDNWNETEEWNKQLASLAPELTLDRPGYDCRMGYPLQVLQGHVKTLGAQHPYIKQWIKSQASVLASCSGNANSSLPEPLEAAPDVAQTQVWDRAYQQASIEFYRDKAKAAALFKVIGQSASPHRAAARYNVANIMANGKDLAGARAEADLILADASLSSVHGITRDLLGYIANLEDTPSGWTALIDNTVRILNQPQAAVEASPESKREYAKALFDIAYAGVTDKQSDWWVTNTLPADATLSKSLADAARKHPMVLWMMLGQSINRAEVDLPWAFRGNTWQTWTTSYVNRALALQPDASALSPLHRSMIDAVMLDSSDATGRAKLWQLVQDTAQKAEKSCGAAPETASLPLLTSQALRASALANDYAQIEAGLMSWPKEAAIVLHERMIPKLMQHILAAGQVEQGRWLRDRYLTPSALASFEVLQKSYLRDNAGKFLSLVAEDEPRFVEALLLQNEKLSAPILNLLPAKSLRTLSADTRFSREQQALLSRAAWTRNFASGVGNSKASTDSMLKLNPEIVGLRDELRKQYPKLSDKQLWTLTILRNPRFGILVNSPDWTDPIEAKRDVALALDYYDHNDKNWWCPLQTDRHLMAIRNAFDEAAGTESLRKGWSKRHVQLLEPDVWPKADAAREAWLKAHPMVKAIDWREVRKLAAMGSAPKQLTEAALAMARKAAPGDLAAAEALALAVVTTRYGCRWHGGHKAYSKPAQELLQRKFKDTAFAKRTPYWFDCMDSVWDAQFNKIPNCKPKVWPKQEPLY